MDAPTLFVGVVSHQASRFSVSQGDEGLAALLALALPGVEVAVNTADLLDESAVPVTPCLVQASLTAELHADAAWARFLGRPLGPRWWARQGLRWIRRGVRAVRPPSLATVRRLLNIELSHLDLMRRGLASEAPWVLILEDDAMSADVADLAAGLSGLISSERSPSFVNLSRSFTTAQLGIDHLLSPSGVVWSGSVPRSVLAASRPVTNTVCAIAYERAFLARLVSAWDALPMTPVLPIDWKLNLTLMRMFESGSLGSATCWLVEPAPITQMSMQPAGILPS